MQMHFPGKTHTHIYYLFGWLYSIQFIEFGLRGQNGNAYLMLSTAGCIEFLDAQ